MLRCQWHSVTLLWYVNTVRCYVVSLRMNWKLDVLWLLRCILAPRSTSLILSGSQHCRLKVLRYRSWNCWMISTVRSTTPYHATTSTRSVTWCPFSCKNQVSVTRIVVFIQVAIENSRLDLFRSCLRMSVPSPLPGIFISPLRNFALI